MKSTLTAVATIMASAAFAAVPAAAQNYGSMPPAQPPQQLPQPGDQDQNHNRQDEKAAAGQPKISHQAIKAVKDLQSALEANNTAEFAAKVQAANAVAKTADDKYMIGVFQYKYGTKNKDDATRVAGLQEMIASGYKDAPLADVYTDLGSTYSRLKQPQQAVQAYQHALQLNPNSVNATAGLAEAKVDAGQPAEAVTLFEKGIALQSAGGAKAPESWYKRALSIAYKAKLPQASALARDWVQAYPSAESWENALAIYETTTQLDEAHKLDLMRLERSVGALSAGDYFNFGDIAVRKGFAGEAKAVLDEGFAANKIKKSDASFSQLYTLASQKAKGDRESLPTTPAGAKNPLVVGDAWYGYGDFAKAADFYRAALAQSDADKSLVNLHLGMALARQGDKAGATAALKAVTGTNADLAKYWLLSLNTKA